MFYKPICFVLITLLLVTDIAAQRLIPLLQPLQTAKAPTNTRWHTFTGPGRDFIVEFPSEPQRGADVELQGGTMQRYRSIEGIILFQFVFWNTGFAPTSREGNQFPPEFQQDRLNQAKQEGWTITRS